MRGASLGLLALSSLAGCGVIEEWQARDAVRVVGNIAYRNDGNPKHRLDLYLPKGAGDFPMVLFVHGGYWTEGDKHHFSALTGLYGSVGIALAERGIGVAVQSYRLSPEANIEGQLDDVVDAIKWTTEHAGEYGADPSSVVLVGHSAGGHLVSLLTLDPHYLAEAGVAPGAIRGAVALSPILDLIDMRDQADAKFNADVTLPVFGAGDDKLRHFSPLSYLSSAHPPWRVMVGGRDYPYLEGQSQNLRQRLVDLGQPADVITVPDCTHQAMVLRMGSRLDPITGKVERFVRRVTGRDAPAPWLLLSEVAQQLARNPKVIEALLARLGGVAKAGGMMGPEQAVKMREAVHNRDFALLDHLPALTVPEMGRAVKLAAQPQARRDGSAPAVDGAAKGLGFGLSVGEMPDPARQAWQPDAILLADQLNRLASAAHGGGPPYVATIGATEVNSPETLLAALVAEGHQIEIRDARYFANFGDLTFAGHEVFTPFWIDTQIVVPGTDETLALPSVHAQHELAVRGRLNADLAFYLGIDGKVGFRPISTKDQAWTLGRVARVYRDADALEVMRLAGQIIGAYEIVQRAHPELPFGGYFPLGVCNDVSAMIEQHMQGQVSLYPLTLDPSLFGGHGEVARLAAELPHDAAPGARADLRRVLATLPIDDRKELPFPELRDQLDRVANAWAQGQVEYTDSKSRLFAALVTGVALWRARTWIGIAVLAGVVMVAALLLRRRRRRR